MTTTDTDMTHVEPTQPQPPAYMLDRMRAERYDVLALPEHAASSAGTGYAPLAWWPNLLLSGAAHARYMECKGLVSGLGVAHTAQLAETDEAAGRYHVQRTDRGGFVVFDSWRRCLVADTWSPEREASYSADYEANRRARRERVNASHLRWHVRQVDSVYNEDIGEDEAVLALVDTRGDGAPERWSRGLGLAYLDMQARTGNADSPGSLAMALRASLVRNLDRLNDYGGLIEDGTRPRFRMTLGDDGTPMGFSLAWYVYVGEDDPRAREQRVDERVHRSLRGYVYAMNGGLLYHGPGGGETFAVNLTRIDGSHLDAWSVHT